MATNAKRIMGYEHTENGLEPMDEERYRAFLQEGIDDLDRGAYAERSVVMADLAAMIAEAAARQAKRSRYDGRYAPPWTPGISLIN